MKALRAPGDFLPPIYSQSEMQQLHGPRDLGIDMLRTTSGRSQKRPVGAAVPEGGVPRLTRQVSWSWKPYRWEEPEAHSKLCIRSMRSQQSGEAVGVDVPADPRAT